ncbi:aminotransferase class V-fold PLP-dependent enzyme [Aliiglaciecola sp. 2_MG-2023]|uniref:aminotransferase class V-fold PLP-dependent enzyme n=1 Tax=unclassified Aliiglaciecola TaxID=2593648 RepID=UPI0026E4051D|nr:MULTISPECIES: aminotransferase class V-fold PLP-dependent enzyme [unclassified Aliiglaciecola]MDO6712793.1 aminotransferase class V-fold PLP-dependent enzyme [Aliiglaciecola sp. 2_MG-2023]MDO6753888.1 aminotransferase class V-fold PLP-dependent enzyme [Aliiglaciecola sp. 1_MG-2023]
MQRREFLNSLGFGIGASMLAPGAVLAHSSSTDMGVSTVRTGDWRALRKLFPLTHDYIQLSTFLLASHPKPVADAIEKHRRAFDENPSDYWHENFLTIDSEISNSAAQYMGGKGENIALTDSTTMGLAMVYSGLKLQSGEEILQTVHDHYSTDMSLVHRANRSGIKIQRIALYDNPAKVNVKEVVARLKEAINVNTRVFAATWVHSSTGVKLPIREMADEIARINKTRKSAQQILFCVDGVHGFGIENQDVSELGCDFFIAGTHKWIFGPRGTGVIWGNDKAWDQAEAVIPSFSASYDVWMGLVKPGNVPVGEHMSPGGFHSFEHRWALPEAFKLHLQLGKENVQNRIHQLNQQTKVGLAKMPHVTLYTPESSALSSGLVCFDVDGIDPETVVKRMHKKGIIMSSTPYRKSYARFAPSLLNNEQEIETALAEISAMG